MNAQPLMRGYNPGIAVHIYEATGGSVNATVNSMSGSAR